RSRFEALQDRSMAMTELQRSMHTERSPAGEVGFKTQSLDKLLWLFLKLLHHKNGLERFLAQTSESHLKSELSDTESQIKDARERNAADRLVTSLEGKRTTIEERLANYSEAVENLQILQAELDKTEQKINHICEVGMTSRDGSDLSHQIDGVADSVKLSEQALAGLDLGTVFEDTETPPPLVSNQRGLMEFQ
ncbi:MAG: exodeoxyribonuclease VII small subunit, partial [Verrucomicrobiae bacterium]|nr:exodeoxyribonuclease VII small subunit [Verrucomicrobiae bacterium]